VTLGFKPYRLQLLQALSEEDKVRKAAFIAKLEEEETLNSHIVFSDEATFHVRAS